MWPFSKTLEDVLHRTKTIRVHGVKFKIKKIDPTSYLDGSKIMTKAYDIYKAGKDPEIDLNSGVLSKIKDHYKDVFLASVVYPKLKRKKEDPDGLLIDNLFTEWALAHELYSEIMQYTHGKKKTR